MSVLLRAVRTATSISGEPFPLSTEFAAAIGSAVVADVLERSVSFGEVLTVLAWDQGCLCARIRLVIMDTYLTVAIKLACQNTTFLYQQSALT